MLGFPEATLTGGLGNDIIYGDQGNDTLSDTAGDNSMTAGP